MIGFSELVPAEERLHPRVQSHPNMCQCRWITLAVLFLAISGANCLKDVMLEVIPEAVERGHEAILRCHYELEDAPLYSLKWYRGGYEFYRYSPTETPKMKVFNITWIDVDLSNSNESQVTLRNVDFAISGNFSCEVTTDSPYFLTSTGSKKLTVVSIPKSKPVIVSERQRYDAGDTLKANCSTSPSKPPARLSFTLNDILVGESATKHHQRKHDYNGGSHNAGESEQQWSELSLTLQPFHYVNGQLKLRCIAEIPDIYSQTSEVQLGPGLREPVPERVTSENANSTSRSIAALTNVFLLLLHFLCR